MIIILIFTLIIILYICIYNFKSRRKVYPNDPMVLRIKHDVCRLDSRINNIEFYSSDESFTEDKQRIYLCLRNEKGEYYNYNMLIYVAIHECAHALTNVIDHDHTTKEFRETFRYLLSRAQSLGLYDPYQPLTKHYCGISLDIENIQR